MGTCGGRQNDKTPTPPRDTAEDDNTAETRTTTPANVPVASSKQPVSNAPAGGKKLKQNLQSTSAASSESSADQPKKSTATRVKVDEVKHATSTEEASSSKTVDDGTTGPSDSEEAGTKTFAGVDDAVRIKKLQDNATKREDHKAELDALGFKTEKEQVEAGVLVYLVGDGGVGKTCLATSFFNKGDFNDDYIPTCFGEHDVYLNAKVNSSKVRTKIKIIDTAGQEDLYNVFLGCAVTKVRAFAENRKIKKKGLVVCLCHKNDSAKSFKNIVSDNDDEDDSWARTVAKIIQVYNDASGGGTSNVSIILCATQTDSGDRAIPAAVVSKHVSEMHLHGALDGLIDAGRTRACECSAYFDYPSVVDVFTNAAEMALNQHFQ